LDNSSCSFWTHSSGMVFAVLPATFPEHGFYNICLHTCRADSRSIRAFGELRWFSLLTLCRIPSSTWKEKSSKRASSCIPRK
jgi:hypothetical protein